MNEPAAEKNSPMTDDEPKTVTETKISGRKIIWRPPLILHPESFVEEAKIEP
jgi:hypothetical protein